MNIQDKKWLGASKEPEVLFDEHSRQESADAFMLSIGVSKLCGETECQRPVKMNFPLWYCSWRLHAQKYVTSKSTQPFNERLTTPLQENYI